MTPATCPQMFQVAALRDERLEGAARRIFERHLQTCAVCAREAAALERLAQAARDGLDDAQTGDDLHVWRERTRLLAAFDRSLISPERPRPIARRLGWSLTAAALLAGLAFAWRARPPRRAAPAARATILADGAAVWSRRPGPAGREEVALAHGTLRVHVDRLAGQPPLVVLLPDGELEDVGTTFTVSADGTATTRVTVEEGRVALRLRGQPAIDLRAGASWPADQPQATPPARVAPVPLEPVHAMDRRPSPRVARAEHPPRVGPPMPASDPRVEFRAAAAALRDGDNAQAAVAFTRFLADHPDDAMAEDAAYLRVIAFQRMGAAGDLKHAAQVYLQQFPSGFRRAEVSRLAR